MRTHDGPHDGTNPHPGCYGCDLKAKNLTVSRSATPSRNLDRKAVLREMKEPSWEKGIAGETRRDGSFMPYLDRTLEPMGVKEMADNRTRFEAVRHRQLHDPNYGKE